MEPLARSKAPDILPFSQGFMRWHRAIQTDLSKLESGLNLAHTEKIQRKNIVEQAKTRQLSKGLRYLAIALLIIGVVFRFVNLNHKVFWHDEVYTVFRAAGYVRTDIDQELFQNRVMPIGDLQRFQQIKPGSTAADTVRSLVIEDPQHPPLYFLLTRWWMQVLGRPLTAIFGSSLTVTRSLPLLISLLALPAAYALAWELFRSRDIGLLAAMLLALSPFDVLFAQTARQYSLLTVMVVVSQWLLLRALRLTSTAHESFSTSARRGIGSAWAWYGGAVAIGLYTQPFFGLTLIAQGVLIGLLWWLDWHALRRQDIAAFAIAVGGAILLYSPWLLVMATNRQRVADTTRWTQAVLDLGYLSKLWLLSFTALFFDLDFGFDNPLTFGLRLPFLLMIMAALAALWQFCDRRPRLALLTMILVPFLLLVGSDLLLQGKRSAISRYLVSSFPGVQIAVAYWLGQLLAKKSPAPKFPALVSNQRRTLSQRADPFGYRLGWVSFVLITVAAIASLTVSATATSWWSKDLSYLNDQVATAVNQTENPILISEVGVEYTNTGDLISLSYIVKPDTPLLGLDETFHFVDEPAFDNLRQNRTAIVFRPSQSLIVRLEARYGSLIPYSPHGNLWRIPSG